VLSCLVPGTGQLYLGRVRRGAAMVAVAAGCVLAGVASWPGRSVLARFAVQPHWLLALLAANAALLAFRVFCVVDAYRLGSAARWYPPRRHGAVVAGAVLVAGLTAAPHVVAGYYNVAAYDLLTSVFQGPGGGSGAAEPGRGPAAGGAPSVPGRLTVLLLGGDAGHGRIGRRTDTMIVASVEPATGRAVLFGLPRNLVRVPLPAGPARAFACGCFPHPLNELYAYAEEHPWLFPGRRPPGVTAVLDAAQRLLGIPIDHYALVDLEGFVQLVDALGGVTVPVSEPVRVEIDRLGRDGAEPAFYLRPGRHRLNGLTALAYARARKETSDYDRMRRQRCLLGSLARQVDAGRLLRAFPRLVPVVKRDVSTDLPLSRLPGLVELAGARRVGLTAVGFAPPDYNAGWALGGYPIPDVARIRATVQAMLAGRAAPAPARPGAATQGHPASSRPAGPATTRPPTGRSATTAPGPAQGGDPCAPAPAPAG
jgi:LCP family protein required for cell wall assembly